MHFLTDVRELESVAHVLVHGPARGGTRLLLDIAPASSTPPELLAVTEAESALAYVRGERSEQERREVNGVACTRFDGSALLAAWTLLHPQEAQRLESSVTAAARASSLGISSTPDATAFVCLLNCYQDPSESPLGATTLALDQPLRDAALFDALLPLTGRMLSDVKDFDRLWVGEYSDVLQSEALTRSGAVQMETMRDIDVLVLDTPLSLHPLVHLTLTAGPSRLLTVRSENTYTLEYRREHWTSTRSNAIAPRIALAPLAARLNLFERREGGWRADPVDVPRPMLYFDAGRGVAAPSSIDRETVLAEVSDFFHRHATDRSLLWTPE